MKYQEALDLIQQYGLVTLHLKCNGVVQRCPTLKHPNARNGWILLSITGDEVWGSFGSYSDGIKIPIKISGGFIFDEKAHKLYKERLEKSNKNKRLLADEAANRAKGIWGRLAHSGVSDYVNRKRINPHGARYGTQRTVAIPLLNINGELRGLQVIYEEKNIWMRNAPDKRFWPRGMDKKGCFFVMDADLGMLDYGIIICEGYATGCSIYEATGIKTVVAFDSGNLLPVALNIKKKYPSRKIVICGDDDYFSPENSGFNKAVDAAVAVGGSVCLPKFRNRGEGDSDWNDLHVSEGLDEVCKQIYGFLDING